MEKIPVLWECDDCSCGHFGKFPTKTQIAKEELNIRGNNNDINVDPSIIVSSRHGPNLCIKR